jgi:predicted permease
MLEIIIVIAPLFLIIFGSAIFQKVTNANDNWTQVLNNYALKIGFPALIFSALAGTTFNFAEEINLILANSIFLLGSFALAFIIGKIFKLKPKLFRTLFICLAFGNVAYLGIPVLKQISGDAVLGTASLIVAIYLFWMFTVGIGFLDYSQMKKKSDVFKKMALNLAKNPLLLAVIFGLLASSLSLSIPSIIDQSIGMIAGSVTPVVLVVIGLFIGKSKIGKIKNWIPVLAFSLVTLFALPALFFYGIKLAGLAPTDFSASIIEAAMPLAITPFALADQYKLHKNFIARSIVLSTILSVISIPFWTSLL